MITRSRSRLQSQSVGRKRKYDHQIDNSISTITKTTTTPIRPTDDRLLFDSSFAPEMIFTINLNHSFNDIDVQSIMHKIYREIKTLTFLHEWIRQSNVDMELVPFRFQLANSITNNEDVSGVGTCDGSRLLLFVSFNRFMTENHQVRVIIHKGCWTIAELEKLMHGFIVTMDTRFASGDLEAITEGKFKFVWDAGRDVNYQYDSRVYDCCTDIVCDGWIQPLIRGFYYTTEIEGTISSADIVGRYDEQVAELPSLEEGYSMSFIENEIKNKTIVNIACTNEDEPIDFHHPSVRTLNQIVTGTGSCTLSTVAEIWIFMGTGMSRSDVRHWMDTGIFQPTVNRMSIIRRGLTDESDEFLPDVLVQLWIDYVVSRELEYQLIDITFMKPEEDIPQLIT